MPHFIRTRFNHYLHASGGIGENVVVVNHRHLDPSDSDEGWWIESVSDHRRQLLSGDAVYIRTRAKRYLNAADGIGENVIVVDRHHPDPTVSDEMWWIESVSGAHMILYGEPVFIRTRQYRYLNAAGGTGENVIVVDRHHPDPSVSDEIWWLEKDQMTDIVSE